MQIQTINGVIPSKKLGKTFIHEHLKIDLSSHKKDNDTNFDDIDAVIDEMKVLRKKGIDAIVEVTNRGMGRDIEAMCRIAKKTGINIILSTGFYKEPFLPQYVYEKEEKELAKLLIDDILIGIDGTDVKAHVIGEVGTSKDSITPMEHKVFKAAAITHLDTGRPISTHTTLGTMALEQLELLKNYSVELSKVVIGHLDLKCDLDYHMRVADTGCFMAFDTIGKVKYQPDEKRIENIVKLIDRGHVGQIVLSQDITRKSHLNINNGIGYSYLLDKFLPKLIEAGVSAADIDKMLIDNPRRLLGV